eukprot:TRINITY_DN30634_c0_g1_i2.p1 TRINITY_DN30634_c0_g1~~TRINITY_DN30634_c0_g1_i2.p1  ORF type:complete len:116 (+),score=24.20 TRINITY_DN30634_c0_g1_i2:296-643(+)
MPTEVDELVIQSLGSRSAVLNAQLVRCDWKRLVGKYNQLLWNELCKQDWGIAADEVVFRSSEGDLSHEQSALDLYKMMLEAFRNSSGQSCRVGCGIKSSLPLQFKCWTLQIPVNA